MTASPFIAGRRCPALVFTCLAIVACSEPLELADWTLPLPEGVPVREHRVAALDGREGDRIEIVTDLIVGGGAGNDDASFYEPRSLVVDEDGRMYVLDGGNYRVQVFAADGAFLNAFGYRGRGPGGLVMPDTMALVDEGIVINDLVNARLSVWSRAGEHLGDHPHGRRFGPHVVFGDHDTLVAAYAEEGPEGRPLNVTARFTLAGEEAARIGEVPVRGLIRVRVGPNVSADYAEGHNEVDLGMRVRDTQPRFALGRDGALYLAAGDEYQLLALDADGVPRWALRSTLPMPAMPLTAIDAKVAENRRTSSRSDYDWDELLPAIDAIRVDGHGHVWVYPTVSDKLFRELEPGVAEPAWPVDVYSSAGELLYSGEVDPIRWHVSLGDFVYRLTEDPETEERTVARYRLVEPFSD